VILRYLPLFVTQHMAIAQRATSLVFVVGLLQAFPPLVFLAIQVSSGRRISQCDKGKK
jgi:hypothetical protein